MTLGVLDIDSCIDAFSGPPFPRNHPMPLQTNRVLLDERYRQILLQNGNRVSVDKIEALREASQLRLQAIHQLDLERRRIKQEKSKDKTGLILLQKEVKDCEERIRSCLWDIPNVVDAGLRLEDDQEAFAEKSSGMTNSKNRSTSVDPVFDIGGYAVVESAVVIVIGQPVWSLSRALEDYFVRSLQRQYPSSKFHQCQSSRVARELYQDLNGRVGDTGEEQVMPPAWQWWLDHHADKVYFDRQLPDICLLSTTSSQSKKSESKKLPWYERVQLTTGLELVALCGSSVDEDSRPLQLQLARLVRQLYQNLSPNHGGVELSVLPVDQLEWNESSCIVLNGFMSGDKIELARISNHQDYVTTSMHGNTNLRVHCIHAQLLQPLSTVEWMSRLGETKDGIRVPPALKSASFYPYTRKVSINKKGRRIVEKIGKKAASRGPLGSPTPEQVRGEALASPFDFLPFYHR